VVGLRKALASAAPTCLPNHIMIGDRAVPEPMREAPEFGADYWLVDITIEDMALRCHWMDTKPGNAWLALGLIHSTEANARAHAEAIIAMSARGDA